jgi:hypothetical protein
MKMSKKKFIVTVLGCALYNLSAADFFPTDSIFYGGAYGGYGHIADAYQQDGNTAQARAMLGMKILRKNSVQLGFEAGIQSGNNMRLNLTPEMINDNLLPAQANLKPMLDFLLSLQGKFSQENALSYFIKAGGAYRELTLTNYSSNHDSIKKMDPEIQLGFGYDLNKQVTVVTYYQGIYGHNSNLQLDNSNNITIAHIPTQQAGFLGVEYHF